MDTYYTGISLLPEVVYQQPGIGSFSMLRELPLHSGFSWGEDSPNFSFNLQKGQEQEVRQRHNTFLQTLGMPSLEKAILIDPSTENEEQIMEVSAKNLLGESPTITGANVLLTQDPTITFLIHPGDCPSVVMYAEKEGSPLLGASHFGRLQTDEELPKRAILYLISLGINPEGIHISMAPSISQDHYWIPVSQQTKVLPQADKWGKYIKIKEQNGEEMYFLDIKGYIVQQLVSCGVKPEHIEVYAVDTYTAAEKGEGFSHRYATATKQPEKNGRFLLAASLFTTENR